MFRAVWCLFLFLALSSLAMAHVPHDKRHGPQYGFQGMRGIHYGRGDKAPRPGILDPKHGFIKPLSWNLSIHGSKEQLLCCPLVGDHLVNVGLFMYPLCCRFDVSHTGLQLFQAFRDRFNIVGTSLRFVLWI